MGSSHYLYKQKPKIGPYKKFTVLFSVTVNEYDTKQHNRFIRKVTFSEGDVFWGLLKKSEPGELRVRGHTDSLYIFPERTLAIGNPPTLKIKGDAPNQSSIEASLDNYSIKGIQWIPASEFDTSFRVNFYSKSDHDRVKELAEKIYKSGWVSPLIAVNDSEGYYILEGGHRLVALGLLKVPSIPALVVIDLDDPPKSKQIKRNPAVTKQMMTIGTLLNMEIVPNGTGTRSKKRSFKNKYLLWDGRNFHIAKRTGKSSAKLSPALAKKHKKFHDAAANGTMAGEIPDQVGQLTEIGLIKALTYAVPRSIKSPGKNPYRWHHAFGDTGHKGGDNYPKKVMPALMEDEAGNLFIKRRKGNIFRVDTWLRG